MRLEQGSFFKKWSESHIVLKLSSGLAEKGWNKKSAPHRTISEMLNRQFPVLDLLVEDKQLRHWENTITYFFLHTILLQY